MDDLVATQVFHHLHERMQGQLPLMSERGHRGHLPGVLRRCSQPNVLVAFDKSESEEIL
jgi:hypothetical protein